MFAKFQTVLTAPLRIVLRKSRSAKLDLAAAEISRLEKLKDLGLLNENSFHAKERAVLDRLALH
jgi:hypothetical protein